LKQKFYEEVFMGKIFCSVCREKIFLKEIFAFYPEDDSCICKNCFAKMRTGNDKKRKNTRPSKKFSR